MGPWPCKTKNSPFPSLDEHGHLFVGQDTLVLSELRRIGPWASPRAGTPSPTVALAFMPGLFALYGLTRCVLSPTDPKPVILSARRFCAKDLNPRVLPLRASVANSTPKSA